MALSVILVVAISILGRSPPVQGLICDTVQDCYGGGGNVLSQLRSQFCAKRCGEVVGMCVTRSARCGEKSYKGDDYCTCDGSTTVNECAPVSVLVVVGIGGLEPGACARKPVKVTTTTPAPPSTEKPVHEGSCPAVPSDSFGLCVEGCLNDGSCELNEKCCSNGCGRTCVLAVPDTVRNEQCPAPSDINIDTCEDQCERDHQCDENEICCSNGCSRVCLAVSPRVVKCTNGQKNTRGAGPCNCPKHCYRCSITRPAYPGAPIGVQKECHKCRLGYALNKKEQRCVLSAKATTVCTAGKKLEKEGQPPCDCGIDNCYRCNLIQTYEGLASVCKKCKNGYLWDKISGQCVASDQSYVCINGKVKGQQDEECTCPAHCTRCASSGTMKRVEMTCTQCADGFRRMKQECLPVVDQDP